MKKLAIAAALILASAGALATDWDDRARVSALISKSVETKDATCAGQAAEVCMASFMAVSDMFEQTAGMEAQSEKFDNMAIKFYVVARKVFTDRGGNNFDDHINARIDHLLPQIGTHWTYNMDRTGDRFIEGGSFYRDMTACKQIYASLNK